MSASAVAPERDAHASTDDHPRPRAAGALLRHWPLWVSLLVVLAGRITLYDWPISPDESGFFMVADDLLHHGGDGIYGHYWVDRPPLLIWLFTVAAVLGTVEAIRWLVALFFVAFVVMTYVVVRRLGGAAGWAVAVAAAFSITPEVGAQVANGEAFAIPFVIGGILCTVVAQRHVGGRALLWSAVAGLTGFLAMAVKQNFFDGLAFAFVLLVVSGLRGERSWADVVRRLAAGVAGIVVGILAMVAYALTTGAGAAGLWLAAVSFRGDASRVIRAGYRTGIENRTEAIIDNAWVAGIIPMLIVLVVVALLCRLRGSAVSWAVGVVILIEVVGIVVGGNFWSHYLLGLAPGLALATGLAGAAPSPATTPPNPGLPTAGRGRWILRNWRRLLVLPVAAYLVGCALVVTPSQANDVGSSGSTRALRIGGFVADSAEPGDTATTLFGRPDAQLATGLRSPYEQLWSLPVRVLDPDLEQLTALLGSDDAPTWLVQVFSIHEWGLDPQGRIDPVIEKRYEIVYDACRTRVYKLKTVQRELAPPPTC
ncbi:ArnT family glycosyltransferase [Nocardioides jensenii]|uniref:ArnT family glycosyltransferase n=1 Tax=Nocardioides jensenii TaxID=1843 RepID=UPI0012FBC4BC|nr:hypothetical protein [Nocardioides jensenii]